MPGAYLTAVVVITLLAGVWLAVQRLWLRQFPGRGGEHDDALGGQGGCRGCHCEPGQCRGDAARRQHQPEEGSSHAP